MAYGSPASDEFDEPFGRTSSSRASKPVIEQHHCRCLHRIGTPTLDICWVAQMPIATVGPWGSAPSTGTTSAS